VSILIEIALTHTVLSRLDATDEMFGIARLINHANPTKANAKAKLIEVDGYPRLYFVASRDIERNEEIRYDYGDRRKEILETHPFLGKKFVTPDSTPTP